MYLMYLFKDFLLFISFIFLLGGGNWGDLWFGKQRLRRLWTFVQLAKKGRTIIGILVDNFVDNLNYKLFLLWQECPNLIITIISVWLGMMLLNGWKISPQIWKSRRHFRGLFSLGGRKIAFRKLVNYIPLLTIGKLQTKHFYISKYFI